MYEQKDEKEKTIEMTVSRYEGLMGMLFDCRQCNRKLEKELKTISVLLIAVSVMSLAQSIRVYRLKASNEELYERVLVLQEQEEGKFNGDIVK